VKKVKAAKKKTPVAKKKTVKKTAKKTIKKTVKKSGKKEISNCGVVEPPPLSES